jgi:hypothetical protein
VIYTNGIIASTEMSLERNVETRDKLKLQSHYAFMRLSDFLIIHYTDNRALYSFLRCKILLLKNMYQEYTKYLYCVIFFFIYFIYFIYLPFFPSTHLSLFFSRLLF